MALLCFNSLPSLSSSSRLQPSPSPSSVFRSRLGFRANAVSSCNQIFLGANSGITRRERPAAMVMVKAAASGVGGNTEEPKAVVPVEELPLQSKEQQLMEQRMKMKLAKKIRLRRKRLLRKRKMRKKGRWPPSKMKKLKNV
ncbi:PREDICTED: 50S ribosomal protein 5, chloroplastic [Tarenaya hassleriana]|uniref:50S ribosomal protein 5, chloroplastic n=1 Tax=Tarenaya hassleriana TaxID=28532 RepID=UPI00053C6209|nr:PREDICTED: 50S ribosomal protein 5, chloroplastic [Tarenaya hassleriana]